jgi:Transcriptional activator of glycolytic enzymes
VDQALLAQQNSNTAFQNAVLQRFDTLTAQQAALMQSGSLAHAPPPLPQQALPHAPLPPQLAVPHVDIPVLPPPPQQVPEVELPDWDLKHDNCLTLLDYWNEYETGYPPQGGRERTPFKVRERLHGTAWRAKKMRQWWGRRRCIYFAVLHFKSQGHTLAHSIDLADAIYKTGQLHGRRNQERSKRALNDFVTAQGLSTGDKDALLKAHEMDM